MKHAGFLLWLLVCGILVLDIGQAYVRAQGDASAKLRTQEVDIVDSSGTVVATVLTTKDGPEIDLADPHGNTRISLGVGKEGTIVSFLDSNQQDMTMFGSMDQDGGILTSLGFVPKNRTNPGLVLEPDGECIMMMMDKAGANRAQISYEKKDDISTFGISPAKGQGMVVAGTTPTLTHIAIDDSNGNPRSDMGLDPDNAGYIGVEDGKGNTTWREAFKPDGSPSDDTGSGSNAQPSGQSDSSGNTGAVRSPSRKRPQ